MDSIIKRSRPAMTMFACSITALMLAQQIRPSDCFSGMKATTTTTRSRTSNVKQRTNALSYRREETVVAFEPETLNDLFASSSYESNNRENNINMPIWLAFDRSHMKDANTRKLTQFLKTSYFTETETLILLKAIEEAAGGNQNLIAGAAEFCLMLAETMEMGLNALIAASFHYCTCVRHRQTGSSLNENTPKHYCGEQVQEIVEDAVRLKQLEMVAAKTSNRKDTENLKHLILTEAKDWRGLAIRSGACLYRLRGIIEANALTDPTSMRVAREALNIYANLASRLGMHRLKNELESAAFQILYQRQYKTVMSRRGDLGETMNNVLESVKEQMKVMLENDEEFKKNVESFEVSARVKEPYSMWKKMLRMNYKSVLQVPDALALRIILKAKKKSKDEATEVTRARERALCYYAEKLCQERWQPDPENPRFKDYIKNPKPNGYQSLHYTAQMDHQQQAWNFEIQVRSAEMHQVAEFGLASHWDYKASQKKDRPREEEVKVTITDMDGSFDAYLRNVQQWNWHGIKVDAGTASFESVVRSDIWQSRERANRIRARTERLQPYLEALSTAQSDLAREHVFVFINGNIAALPSGACVLDALREGERQYGISMSSVVLNGQDTSITRQLHNGDVLQMSSTATTQTATVTA